MTIAELYNKMEGRFDHDDLWWLSEKIRSRFVGGDYQIPRFMQLPVVKRVIFNPPATIIMWSDNTKSVVKCQDGEPFDPEKGFVLAYLKKLLGNDNTFNKEIHKWVKYEAPVEEKVVEDASNEPLTIEDLMKMDGQEVWLSSITNGVENFNDRYCGWRTVNVAEQEVRRPTGFYVFSEMNDNNGFRAYRKPPKQAKVGNENE